MATKGLCLRTPDGTPVHLLVESGPSRVSALLNQRLFANASVEPGVITSLLAAGVDATGVSVLVKSHALSLQLSGKTAVVLALREAGTDEGIALLINWIAALSAENARITSIGALSAATATSPAKVAGSGSAQIGARIGQAATSQKRAAPKSLLNPRVKM